MKLRAAQSRIWILLLASIVLLSIKIHYESRLIEQQQHVMNGWPPTSDWTRQWQATPATDWFDAAEWAKNKHHTCFYVEDICHQTNRFFYRVDRSGRRQQPKMELQLYSRTIARIGHLVQDVPSIVVNQGDSDNMEQCIDSPIQNHMLLSGNFNDMLGEFYSRTLRGLYDLVSYHNIDLHLFRQQTQLYIHRQSRHGGSILDSHSLFTNPWRIHPLADFNTILDSTTCRCLPRLLFCGYHAGQEGSGDRIIVQPASSILGKKRDENRIDTRLYNELRQFLRKQVILDNPLVQEDIEDYRMAVIEDQFNETSVTITREESSKWVLVGLAQRNRRRRWHNLGSAMIWQLRESFRADKIAFVTVNLDEPGVTAYDQVVMHGGLDVLMGIHGAQLTEAVWMKPGSMVVEFLPWIPDHFSYGRWTRTVYKPTPLGVIFGDTDLAHIGVRLDRSSAPCCYNATDEDACFNGRKNRWDERDFVVEPALVTDALARFTLDKPPTCGGYYNKSRDTFVVYNVNCSEAGEPATPHHYYWPKEVVLKNRNETVPGNVIDPRELGVDERLWTVAASVS